MLSNNPMAALILRQHGLAARFSAVVTPDEPYRKPHPSAFAEVCQAVGLAPSVCAYVGDSYLNDVEGAHAAGLTAIWIDRLGDDYPLPPGAFRVTSLLDRRLLD